MRASLFSRKAAVELAISGHSGVMPIIKRVGDSPYRWKIGYEKLSKVANVERFLEASWSGWVWDNSKSETLFGR